MAASYKLFLGFLVVLLAFFCEPVRAADSAYTIDQIKVDVTASNAAAAREQAFMQAQIIAFRTLATRLLSENEMAGFEMPEVSVISALVQDFELLEEQLSHVRYIGTYRFRFRERAVSDFFSNKGISHTDVSSKPVLIIPFYQWGSRNLLWSENNPWLNAWKQSNRRRGLVPVVVPIGDLQDITDVSEEKALAANWSNIENMRARYEAGEVMVLLAIPEWDQEGQITNLRVDIYTLEGDQPEYASSLDVKRRGSEQESYLFERAVTTVREKLQQLWKNMTIVDPRQTNEITVRVSYNDMGEWVRTKTALDGIKMLDDLQVESLNPKEAYLYIKFRGDESRLRLALSQKDLHLSKPQISFSQTGIFGKRQLSPLVYDLYLKDSISNQERNWQ